MENASIDDWCYRCHGRRGLEMDIWVFHGTGAQFASGVFTSREGAAAWIASHRLTGVLTRYPLDQGVYEWAIENGVFTPNRPDQSSSAFIGRFTSASQEHYHFEEGS